MGTRRLGVLLAVLLSVVVVPSTAHATGGTTYTWVGSSQGSGGDNHSWTDTKNWSPAGTPGNGDSVIIEQPSPTDCFAHVDAVPTVELVAFTLLETSALCTTSVSGGSLSISGSLTWNGGKLDTPTTIESTATGEVDGSNQELNALTQNFDVSGTLTLNGANGSGALQILAGQKLHLEPGSSLQSTGSNAIDGNECCTDPAAVVNQGTISVGGSTLTLSTLELDQDASVATSAGGKLVTTAGPVTTGMSGQYSGSGSWQMTDGSAAVFHGTQSLAAGFDLELGGLTSTSSSTSLAGTATLSGAGRFDWWGGTIQAQLTIGHSVTVSVSGAHTGNGSRVLQGRDFTGGGAGVPVTFTNHGAMHVGSNASISTAAQAHLVNASNGVISLEPGTSLSSQACCTAPDRLTNSGLVGVSSVGGSGPVAITGVAYQSTGTTKIAANQTLQLTGGAPNRLAAGTVTGGGHLLITAPTAVSGTINVTTGTRLILGTHGTLDGTAALSGAGRTSWTGGSVSGALTVSTSGGLAISGSDPKTIANIGGGSTPSTMKVTVPTTIAAGTSKAHDVVDVGSSVLTFEAPTHVGTFTEFDNGKVSNHGTFSIGSGRVFARNFTQSTGHTLSVELGAKTRGSLTSIETVSLHGVLAVNNTFVPQVGAKVTVVGAPTLTDSLSCVRTTGKGTRGSPQGHWVDRHNATKLILVWTRGTPPGC